MHSMSLLRLLKRSLELYHTVLRNILPLFRFGKCGSWEGILSCTCQPRISQGWPIGDGWGPRRRVKGLWHHMWNMKYNHHDILWIASASPLISVSPLQKFRHLYFSYKIVVENYQNCSYIGIIFWIQLVSIGPDKDSLCIILWVQLVSIGPDKDSLCIILWVQLVSIGPDKDSLCT